MASYGFQEIIIENLDQIDLRNSNKVYYTYKGCDFYYKRVDTSDKLLVGFHASIDNQFTLPIFRYHEYDTNILSIADSFLKKYRHTGLRCAWYMSTKSESYNDVYLEILSYFIKPSLYNNVVFAASSGGGFPAIRYGCYFKANVIVMNTQFYLYNNWPFNHIVTYSGLKKNDFVDFDIHAILKGPALYNKLIIYQNTRDTGTFNSQYIPFKVFLEGTGLTDNVEFCEFYGADPVPIDRPHGHHCIMLPENTMLISVVDRLHNM